MIVKFYKITDDKRTVSKHADISHLQLTLSDVHIKSDCSILDPVLEVAYNSKIMQCNYIKIEDWNRYYFIKDIDTSMQRLYVSCHVDVLMSHKTGILDLTCVVARQENNAQMYLPDGIFRALTRRVVSTPYKFNTVFNKNQSIVLTTGGKS